MTFPKIENMTSSNGNKIANQFLIYTDQGVTFQSYETVIAHRDVSGRVTLDRDKWDFSTTTGKYLNAFLGETIKETRKKIEDGTYTLENLN